MKYHVFNPCAPLFDQDDADNTGIQGVRKGIVVELFFTYLIYFIICAKGAKEGIYPPNPEKASASQNNKNDASQQQNKSQDDGNDLQKEEKKSQDNQVSDEKTSHDYWVLEEWFYTFYQYHLIITGVALLYSPYPFMIIMCYFHFILFLAIVGYNYKKKTDPTEREKQIKVTKILYALCQLINLMILIAGLASLNSTSKDDYTHCPYTKEIYKYLRPGFSIPDGEMPPVNNNSTSNGTSSNLLFF